MVIPHSINSTSDCLESSEIMNCLFSWTISSFSKQVHHLLQMVCHSITHCKFLLYHKPNDAKHLHSLLLGHTAHNEDECLLLTNCFPTEILLQHTFCGVLYCIAHFERILWTIEQQDLLISSAGSILSY